MNWRVCLCRKPCGLRSRLNYPLTTPSPRGYVLYSKVSSCFTKLRLKGVLNSLAGRDHETNSGPCYVFGTTIRYGYGVRSTQYVCPKSCEVTLLVTTQYASEDLTQKKTSHGASQDAIHANLQAKLPTHKYLMSICALEMACDVLSFFPSWPCLIAYQNIPLKLSLSLSRKFESVLHHEKYPTSCSF